MGLLQRAAILKADGNKVPLHSLKAGDLILGLENGQFVENRIISKTGLPVRSDWIKLSGPRIGYVRSGATYSLIVSPDQLIGSKGERAGNLNGSETVPAVFDSLVLTEVQKSILLGVLLGDGTLKTANSVGGSKSLKWVHGHKQEDYLEWTIRALGGLAKRSENHISGYGSLTHSARTIFHPEIEAALSGFDKPAGTIPNWVIEKLNPIAMAYWYMDDGSLTHNENQRDRVTFSTNSFSMQSHEVLIAALAKFGLTAVIQESAKGPSLRLNADSADLFFCLIAPYIPPSMQYKLPSYYRGNQGWIPVSHFEFRKIIVDAQINYAAPQDLSPATHGGDFVLKTEIGNYFANGLLLSES
jgi:hypothetical protein